MAMAFGIALKDTWNISIGVSYSALISDNNKA